MIFISAGWSQEDSTFYYFDQTTPERLIKAKIEKTKDPALKSYYRLVYFSKNRNVDSMGYYLKKIDAQQGLPATLLPRLLYLNAYYNRILDNDSLAFVYHQKALIQATKNEDTLTILNSLSGLSQSWDYKEDNHYRLDYLEKLKLAANKYNNQSFSIIYSYLLGNYHLFRDHNTEALNNYKKVLANTFGPRDSILLVGTLGNIGALYQTNISNPDSAIYYYNKKLNLIETNPNFGTAEHYLNVYNNLGKAYATKKNYLQARLNLEKALEYNTTKNKVFNELMIAENLAEVNAGLGYFKEGFYNLKNVIKLSDSLSKEEHQESIANIIENYDNDTLKSNLKQQKIQQRNLWIGASILMVVLSVISYLIFKNAKRKQYIAEQQREIEIQKTEKMLKEQELTTIDAMIAGQEKERERVASDLHDSVGATLAAAKLQFNHLKNNKGKLPNEAEIFEKTSVLLEDAYSEIRAMAHLKNSGVIAKNGLLPAVTKLAKNASGTNNLTIDVQDFGLDERLENSMEIAVFRIIQELVTNIIKHSKASEASISITQHTDSLNIIVEDNGRGFNPKQIHEKDGMGLANIERRVEHLEGSMEVDSTIGRGTTVLIDIPI
ncbi:sensor histidine kinase [Aequorivita sp. MCCC 1A16923]|uniref:Oxygen sensor histidine kinase NreB n=2 Tax=Aequorivita flava TaxID=3114371 RepID=A0AB35YTN5_9FLAO